MSDNVRSLHAVQPPTADEEAKAAAVELLKELLAEAERGEIVELAVIVMRPGEDEWADRATPTRNKSAWIGKLMIMMVGWIGHMNEEDHEQFNKGN